MIIRGLNLFDKALKMIAERRQTLPGLITTRCLIQPALER